VNEVSPVTIDLDIGYTDKKQVRHTRVTFGSRLSGKTLFAIDSNPQGVLQTQYSDLILRAGITEFGSLKMPVALEVLLGLDSLDRDDLTEGYGRFAAQSLDGRESEQVSDDTVKLAIGFEKNGLRYDTVRFGTRLTGMDEVAADRLKLEGVKRRCFLAGRQAVSLSQSDGESVLEGTLSLETFEALDTVDLYAIVLASEVWRHSFRRPGARVPQDGPGAERGSADERTASVGK
jgi:hypothetical protein